MLLNKIIYNRVESENHVYENETKMRHTKMYIIIIISKHIYIYIYIGRVSEPCYDHRSSVMWVVSSTVVLANVCECDCVLANKVKATG